MPSRSNNSKISMKVGQRDSKQDILHQERIETVRYVFFLIIFYFSLKVNTRRWKLS